MTTATSTALALHEIDGEPRVLDTDLAAKLGYADPTDIREVIGNHLAELHRWGIIPSRTEKTGKRGRPRVVRLLNEPQALNLVMFVNTPTAEDVRHEVIDVFLAWRHGHLKPHQRPEIAAPRTLLEALEAAVKAERGRLIEQARADAAEAQAAVLRADNEVMEEELYRVTVDEYRALTHAYWTHAEKVRMGIEATRPSRDRWGASGPGHRPRGQTGDGPAHQHPHPDRGQQGRD